jgi:hypothetical protein
MWRSIEFKPLTTSSSFIKFSNLPLVRQSSADKKDGVLFSN